MGSSKSICNLKLQNLLLQFKSMKVEQHIKDQPRAVTEFHYCRSQPKIRNQVKLVGLSRQIIQQMGLQYQEIKQHNHQTAEYLSGNLLLPGSQPICNNYCGFQFGVWAGQLGDGRAHTLGQIQRDKRIYELQLKGSGKTPFSRHADGNSVLSSALRQFLASQLLYGLRVPTTRAASLVVANQDIIRDPFYNGNLRIQNAAIVLRICQSFLRFGSVQVCIQDANMTSKNPLQNRKTLLPLFDYLLEYCYHDISSDDGDPYEQMYKIIVQKTAQLVAYWQAIGFVHGVLNTDNMSLVNVTIDFGPFAFIDYFSKDYISNQTDQHERYSYRRQPQVVKWNLMKLAEAMDPIVPKSVLSKYLEANFEKIYNQKYYALMHEKLGLPIDSKNNQLIDELFQVMDNCSSHFTNAFRLLEKYFSTEFDKDSLQTLIKQLVSESCPKQFYLKNLRAFPTLLGRPYDQILKYDSGFNIYFVKEQQKRVKILKTLMQQSCKQRNERQKSLWNQWLQKYIQAKPKIIPDTCPKYVLLNQIAKKINSQLIQIKDPKQQVNFIQKMLQVFYQPYHQNKWFEQKYWKLRPIPVKLTCSS